MTSWRIPSLCLSGLLALVLSLSAQAQDIEDMNFPGVTFRVLKKTVNFSKPPHLVEGYNKVRFTLEDRKTPEGLVLKVTGRAYYPDGIKLRLGIRYWKHKQYFSQAEVKIKNRAFATQLGPFKRAIPRGELVVEAYFDITKQPKKIISKMKQEPRHFSCSPPCTFDRLNLTRASYDLGGQAGQREAVGQERAEFEKLLQSVLDARRVAERTFISATRSKTTPEALKATLATLERDLRAAQRAYRVWLATRQFLLFPDLADDLRTLGGAVLIEGKLHALHAGLPITVRGGPKVKTAGGRATPFMRYGKSKQLVREQVQTLRGQLSEEGALDRQWEELAKQARKKFMEYVEYAKEQENKRKKKKKKKKQKKKETSR